jgi:GNAT superfamily N-acetyltransferase
LKLNILKIKLNELESFVNSETVKQFEVTPISMLRVQSYIHNPHGLPNDVVLYVGLIEEKLVAFRTIFAGLVQTENETQRFGWCSGNWVHPGFRRKGFSEQLLNEALADWNGKLMFTNYAPNSEKLYLKTGKFSVVHQFQGFRGYLFPKTTKLISFAKKNRVAQIGFSIIDSLIFVFALARTWFYRSVSEADINFEVLNLPDAACYDSLKNNSVRYYFNREEQELRWIFKFPWIAENKPAEAERYPFSSYSNDFKYYSVKVFDEKVLAGFFIFSVRNGHLKTLFFNLPARFDHAVAVFLKQFCINQKIEVITVYNSGVARQLFSRKFPFLRAKKYGQKIYSSFEIKNQQTHRFQDGDGDVIFT